MTVRALEGPTRQGRSRHHVRRGGSHPSTTRSIPAGDSHAWLAITVATVESGQGHGVGSGVGTDHGRWNIAQDGDLSGSCDNWWRVCEQQALGQNFRFRSHHYRSRTPHNIETGEGPIPFIGHRAVQDIGHEGSVALLLCGQPALRDRPRRIGDRSRQPVVVRHHKQGAGVGGQGCFEPLDAWQVEVVRRLIEDEDQGWSPSPRAMASLLASPGETRSEASTLSGSRPSNAAIARTRPRHVGSQREETGHNFGPLVCGQVLRQP